MRSYKSSFSHALAAHPERLHLAAHSHHPWPDVSRNAQIAAWDDAARLLDGKWDRVLGEVLPEVRSRIAALLHLPDPSSVVVAPNTHEFLVRLASSFPHDRPVRLLSSGSEFHSFTRQAERWVEAGRATRDVVPVEPFDTFADRFAAVLAEDRHDLVWVSQVMFDSGWHFEEVFDVLTSAKTDAVLVVDGYHGFMALETSVGAASNRVFYVAGGYKYAMSGEGVCFLHCPPGVHERPVDTGWFAGFDTLARSDGGVAYAPDATRFFGSTFDPTGLYRFAAVQRWLADEGLTPRAIHDHVVAIQTAFLDHVRAGRAGSLSPDDVLPGPDSTRRGNFVCFRRDDAGAIARWLGERGVVVDARGDRLRVGFGIYHDLADAEHAATALGTVPARW
ncbi:MAG: aminotransferase [Planctomycetota bacterium]